MEHVRPADKTATLGLDQRYQPLHIKEIALDDGSICLQTQWRPDADELAALNAGGVVILNLLGRGHPPVHLTAWLSLPTVSESTERGESNGLPPTSSFGVPQ